VQSLLQQQLLKSFYKMSVQLPTTRWVGFSWSWDHYD